VSEQLSIIEAQARLHARLWTGECTLDEDSRLAVTSHRLWSALREQRFFAGQHGRRLSPHDLIEALRLNLFSKAELTVDTEGFTAWISGVVPVTGRPCALYMTAVEAAYFLAWGAFLTKDDIGAIGEAQIKFAREEQTISARRNSHWDLAQQKLFRAHVEGSLILLGRRAPNFGADAAVDLTPVPKEFFADRGVMLWLSNRIYSCEDPARPIYRDVSLATAEFAATFLSSERVASRTKRKTERHRAPTSQDSHAFNEWAKELQVKRRFGPSRKEAEDFAAERHINREWARREIAKLPIELRQQRGGNARSAD
jgi:hypothetical protein